MHYKFKSEATPKQWGYLRNNGWTSEQIAQIDQTQIREVISKKLTAAQYVDLLNRQPIAPESVGELP